MAWGFGKVSPVIWLMLSSAFRLLQRQVIGNEVQKKKFVLGAGGAMKKVVQHSVSVERERWVAKAELKAQRRSSRNQWFKGRSFPR